MPLLQVSCILEPPQNVTKGARLAAGFKGYFSRLGETVALIDLREAQGLGSVSAPSAKVLLTGERANQIGFLVENVVSIEVSCWREREQGQGGYQTLVQLGSDDAPLLLPYCALAGLTPVETPEPAFHQIG